MKKLSTAEKNRIKKIFQTFEKNNIAPTTELKFTTPFELLIAVVLSAQATDKRVNQITPALFTVANTPEQILELGLEPLLEYIKSINYFRTKGKNIFKIAEILVQHHHSQVPKTREDLESLPGVGRKTANVLLNTLYDQPTIPVDTHIFRVAQRLGLAQGKTPLHIEEQLMEVVPQEYLSRAHHWLVLHGRYICVARMPKCKICPINRYCPSREDL